MAISNYAELQQAVRDYTHRDDLDGAIPNFVALAEARFNRTIQVDEMERRVTTTLTTEYAAFPADLLSVRNIQLNDDSGGGCFLEYLTPQQLDEQMQKHSTGVPRFYTIMDSQFQFAPFSAGPHTIEISYYQKVPALGGAVTTNWLLSAHPDVYLYGSLLQAEAFGYKDERVPMWKMAYDEAITEIRRTDERKRWSGGAITMRYKPKQQAANHFISR